MKQLVLIIITLLYMCSPATAQKPRYEKLSPMLRQLVRDSEQRLSRALQTATGKSRDVCAFIRISDQADEVLASGGARSLARFGNIHIANIPIDRLGALSADCRVQRIEARQSHRLHNDSMGVHLNALPAYTGQDLPQAYTGRGVVMGIMDVGFDLTHPTFYDRTATDYRIRCLWDQLSQDTVGSPFYVGRDYMGREELLALGHSRDGLIQTHGTHTLGTAAGSGYDSPYQGLAPEADICLVANAVNDDIELIDSADIYKYTYATDALGFKYIFDQADRMGQPCVISFSEGSIEDFHGYDQLYYEVLDSLTGPGHIIVASAGNQGYVKSWFRKPRGEASKGAFLRGGSSTMTLTLTSADDFQVRLVSYTDEGDTLTFASRQVVESEDSTWQEILRMEEHTLVAKVSAYPSCYDAAVTCYDVTLLTDGTVGSKPLLSMEILGEEADVEYYRVDGFLRELNLNPELNAGDYTHNVHSPASAPSVIAVGCTQYREGVVNYKGDWKEAEHTPRGLRNGMSSVGPTFDGRIKPDVMAPGVNIISSYSSYYLEQHPDAYDITWDVEHFDFQGRTYAWNSNSGTSMSSPAVGGAIALWLQARPTLTPQEVLATLSRTCRHNEPQLSYPNNEYGYGEIDVYRGLLDLLGTDKIKDVSQRHTRAHVRISGSQLLVTAAQPLRQPVRLRLYGLDGRYHLQTVIPAGPSSFTFTLPPLSTGVYAVQLDGEESVSGSTLVRVSP